MTDLNLRIGQATDVGRIRQDNEDYVECFVPTDRAQLASKGAIFLVADGMGGHLAGEVASRQVVKQVIQRYYLDESPDAGRRLANAFESANQAVYALAQADTEKMGMGTTLTAAVILGQKLYVANVGDSRAYLLRRKRLRQITDDHSWVEEQVRTGTLTREQAEQHPQRNLITRAMGTRPTVKVDLFEVELGQGDTLLLCTDGLNGQVTDREIAQVVRRAPPPQAAAELTALANEHGGKDNVSVVIVQMGGRNGSVGQQPPGLTWLAASRKRQVALLLGSVMVCLCAMIASFPVVNQRLVGEPAAAPRPAPIHYADLSSQDFGFLSSYLGYATVYELKSAHPDQPGLENLPQANLWPARQGLFVVGPVRNWECREQRCSFRLKMAQQVYDVHLDQRFFRSESQSLKNRRVRVFGQRTTDSNRLDARLIDLGARWWAWWKPAWATVYVDHDWSSDVWVFTSADENPYSPIEMAEYPALQRGDPILARGRWIKGESSEPMAFLVQSLYRLENNVYTATTGGAEPTPQPTVTLQPTGTTPNP